MRVRTIIATTATLGATVVVGPLAGTASAAVATSSSGTVVTVTMTGDGAAQFECISGKVDVNFAEVAPAVTCAALTQVTVTGDGGNQSVYGDQLAVASFPAGPRLVATMGDGSDYVRETLKSDSIDTGPGDDGVDLFFGGTANSPVVNLGSGTGDAVGITDTPLNDSIAVTSTNATFTALDVAGSVLGVATATGAENVYVHGSTGNDTISSTAVTAASIITDVVLEGGAGDDTLTTGVKGGHLYGGPGTNTMTGSTGVDSIYSSSSTDVIDPGDDGSTDQLSDQDDSLHMGGRTYTHLKTADVLTLASNHSDTVARIRPGATAGTVLATMSLSKFGQQVLPSTLGFVTVAYGYSGRPAHQALLDAVASGVRVNGSTFPGDHFLADFTVPTGSWTVNASTGFVQVVPAAPGLATMSANEADDYRVHGPWTNKDKGFVHRVTRDLVFRFLSDSARDTKAAQLTAHATTRPAIISGLMDTDEYRGLDVDRVFLDYLRRTSDPDGRTYWINSLRSGKSLTKFRAQLFGSNEYFTKAGSTNSQYMVKAYADVLGRLPDPSGQAYWTTKLDGGTDRGTVALAFLSSTEARRNIVKDQFLRFLDRVPTTAESTTWVTNLSGAQGEQQLIAFLAGSTAYYDRS